MAKALFLDRDGTINVDTGYVYERAKFTFLDGVFDFCRRAQEKGYLIIVITNQSGIARGYYTEADYERLTAWMRGEFAAHGVTVTDVFHCPALEGPDRKPAPGLFLKARDRYAIDMAASVNIGDKPRDLEAGERAGVGTNLLFTGDWRTMALPTADAAKTPEQQAAERTFGVAFTAFERLSVGNSSRNYRATTAVGERYFVKFASPKVIDLAITRDRLMKSPRVPALAFGGVRGELGDQAFCAFEWLDGLESFPPHTYTEGQIRSICDFHAQLMNDFAALPHDGLQTRAGFDTRTHGATPRVIHGDFHCRNFGFRDGRVCACFDFESMRLGLAAEDLLRIFVHALERTRFWRVGRILRTVRNLTTCVRLSGLGRDEFLAALDLYVLHKRDARRRKKRLPVLARIEEPLRAPLYRLLRRAILRAPLCTGR